MDNPPEEYHEHYGEDPLRTIKGVFMWVGVCAVVIGLIHIII
jgi:hypothetical protein